MEALAFRAALARLPRLSGGAVAAALRACGSLEALAEQPLAELATLGWHPETLQALRQLDNAMLDADLAACRTRDIRLLVAGEPNFPPSLLALVDAPPMIFIRGQIDALALPQVAIVGSRHPTGPGCATARQFAEYFTAAGLVVTSGLALGIDAAAHEGALAAQGLTIAVCGTGLDQDYPREHGALAARIAAHGALLSEFPPGTPPRAANFPQRNRLISGLALGVVVVEAARRSGSLVTARCAGEQNKVVCAVPGSIHSPQSHGCHQLIRSGATLVESAEQVLEELHLPLTNQIVNSTVERRQTTLGGVGAMDKDYEILFHALGYAPATLDQLVARTGLAAGSVASMLLILELQGAIEARPGGWYQRQAQATGPG